MSSNISNAMTEGYGRRSLAVSSEGVASYGGVRMDGVVRHTDTLLLSDKRQAEGDAAGTSVLADHAQRMSDLVGAPLDGDSLTGRLDTLDSALIMAASDPSSNQRLRNVAQSADALADKLNAVSDGIQASRRTAEASIAQQVDQLNTSLTRIADINTRIARTEHVGADSSALLDQRQIEIDRVAEMVPLRVIPRKAETVALYSMGGTLLLDGQPPEFAFQRSNEIAPHMTVENGLLSGLTMNGRAVDAGSDGSMSGGSLSALFEVRDDSAPDLQAKIDGVALDLAERLGAGGPDTTLGAGDPGLFTDLGGGVDPAQERGLAGRLTLNSSVGPNADTLWKLRDGLGAATTGDLGDAGLINGWRDALSERTPATSGALRSEAVEMTAHIAELVSFVTDTRLDTEQNDVFAGNRLNVAQERL
ncbi:MAG: FlgK family flagellar hook-associated protein, partial [Paracoccaceae bacterium]